MLFDDTSTVNAHDLSVREGLSDNPEGLLIEIGLVISRTEHRPIHYQEVGIGGRESLALKDNRSGRRQLQEPVGLSLQGSEGLQLLFH